MSCARKSYSIEEELPDNPNGPFFRVHCSCGGGSGLFTTREAAESFANDDTRPCYSPEMFAKVAP